METNAPALVGAIRAIAGRRHLCVEEGTLAGWLYEVLSPHVEELVVAGVSESRGTKNDKLDAFARAEQLRIGAIGTKVYKSAGRLGRLRHLAKAYAALVSDSVRVQNRINSLLRSRSVVTNGRGAYAVGSREEWLARLPEAARPQAELLYIEHDALMELRRQAQKALVAEARKHRAYRLVRTCPGLGPVRAAEVVAVVVTPYRFRNKGKFWKYCGLGVVMRSSSDWVRTRSGDWVRARGEADARSEPGIQSYAQACVQGGRDHGDRPSGDEPLYRHYLRLLNGGTKPNLAKLTIARQIGSIVLAVWRNEEAYDPRKLAALT